MQIPPKGLDKETVLQTLQDYKGEDMDWKSGRVLGYVYDPGEQTTGLIEAAYTMYLSENGLDPLTYPSLLKLENEVVGMLADLLQGGPQTVGNFTSGGTESLILAVKTARDYARATRPHIKTPEMILPVTAHASFYKAAHYLDVKPVVTPVHDESFRADVAAMQDAVTDNTILLVGSAPSYAHGVVDPIPQIGALAQEKNLLFHVDACVGGIHLSYMKKLGDKVPDFNLSVPGVTSLSVDLHKYGYAAKNASVILYRDSELRRHQIFACSRWTGYTVINPTVASSKTGGPLAAAWAVMNYLGDEGYLDIVREVMTATRMIIDGIRKIPGVRILGDPDMCMFSIASDSEQLSVYRLADEMKRRGWFLQPQFARANSPANLHISLNRSTVTKAKALLEALEAAIEDLHRAPGDPAAMDLRREIGKLALGFDGDTFLRLAEMAGVTGNELPERMEKINLLLEALPYDVSEFMLIEFLNNLMVPER
jgi:glutamate/tyrosine decarboxylase-like PLP-dependent enzyme